MKDKVYLKLLDKFKDIKNDKRKFLIFVIGIVVVFLILLFILFNVIFDLDVVSKITDGEKFKSEYESLNGVANEEGNIYLDVNLPINNNFKYTNVNSIVDIFNNRGDGVIYFGYASCPYCRTVVQLLSDSAIKSKLDTIYYIDTQKNIINNELLDILNDDLIVNEGNNKSIYIPSVLFVANGEIVGYNKGTLFSHKNPYKRMDNAQIEGLFKIYNNGISSVMESIKVKQSYSNSNSAVLN